MMDAKLMCLIDELCDCDLGHGYGRCPSVFRNPDQLLDELKEELYSRVRVLTDWSRNWFHRSPVYQNLTCQFTVECVKEMLLCLVVGEHDWWKTQSVGLRLKTLCKMIDGLVEQVDRRGEYWDSLFPSRGWLMQLVIGDRVVRRELERYFREMLDPFVAEVREFSVLLRRGLGVVT